MIVNIHLRPWGYDGVRFLYLACKNSTQADDDQDVEDGRAHDCADSNVSFSDEDTWGWETDRGREEGMSDMSAQDLALFGCRLDRNPYSLSSSVVSASVLKRPSTKTQPLVRKAKSLSRI